ncbi:hypothetical protein ColLi_09315 [Colletotrichum liriopes]|uniref:Uncharacterized protein n=1 Tax=Colletotrichum liriopes TaxID=708192 RepID=A0AA37GU14_9PEZI|nr:hypothetical protein ColLi_09315 [Colletotrichum liriopes]
MRCWAGPVAYVNFVPCSWLWWQSSVGGTASRWPRRAPELGSTARLSAAESSNERGSPAVGLHQAASEGQLDLASLFGVNTSNLVHVAAAQGHE